MNKKNTTRFNTNRKNFKRTTSTGYRGGSLYNSARVLQPKPYQYNNILTIPIEWQSFLTVKALDDDEFTYKTPSGTMTPGTVFTLDIKQESKTVLYNQIQQYQNMIKGIYLKAMTIEFISVMDKSTTIGSTLFVKTKYSSEAPTVGEMTTMQPITLLVSGQSRMIIPRVPRLNQQIVAAPGLQSTDFANKWTEIPSTADDLDLAIPNLYLYLPTPYAVLTGNILEKPAYIINVKFKIGLMKSDALNEIDRPSIVRRAWKGVKKIASNGVVQAVAKSALKAALGA